MTTGDSRPELPLDPDAGPLDLRSLALVVIGGGIGSLARYGIAAGDPTHSGWPTATFIANLAGAFILGVLLESLARRGSDRGVRRRLRLLIGTGFCGGLTTYSTFAVEIDLLIHHGRSGLAAAYAVVSVLAGFGVAALGIAAGALNHRRFG